MPQSQTSANPRHQEEKKNDKNEHVQTNKTNAREAHWPSPSSPSEVIAMLEGMTKHEDKEHGKTLKHDNHNLAYPLYYSSDTSLRIWIIRRYKHKIASPTPSGSGLKQCFLFIWVGFNVIPLSIDAKFTHARNEPQQHLTKTCWLSADSGQPPHPRSHIRVYAVCTRTTWWLACWYRAYRYAIRMCSKLF